MTQPTLESIIDEFTGKIAQRLDASRLDGDVRLDPTRTVVLLSIKDKGQIHVHVNQQINDAGVESVLRQLRLVPSLQGLVLN